MILKSHGMWKGSMQMSLEKEDRQKYSEVVNYFAVSLLLCSWSYTKMDRYRDPEAH